MPIIIGEGRAVALTSELTGTLDDVSEAAVTPRLSQRSPSMALRTPPASLRTW
ncbi:hypothetical protein RA224_21975 [Achromobacter aegrifaciens]|uniref:hypothetical protein n=1 Tax=Achromobacter aegrifaciens TaxID=1287736 RepID=UPI0027BA98AC|nr:hypothetical protein [Achromobacter aegrifaciens]WLW59887.1 hypothetical protein RA224_21975 [Achromobacter aegrifaciens]